MSIVWDGYEIYDPGVHGPLGALTRADARAAFRRLMDAVPARIEVLGRLLAANHVQLRSTDEGLLELNRWFYTNVESDPNAPGRLLPDWYSVVNDVALFLGETMIDRCPTLRWEFLATAKKAAAYQRHVIAGFTRVQSKNYYIDIDHRVAIYAHRIIRHRGSVARYGVRIVRGVEIDIDAVASARHHEDEIPTDVFWRWIKVAESEA